MKTLVTGGGGFLGSHLVARLEADGHDVVVPRRAEVDLTHWDEAERLFRDTQPERVFHLAGEVGGIGANRLNPGRFWYANLMMGAHVLELSREHGVGKLVIAGTVCAYPKFAPVPFREADLWDGYPEETNAPYGVAKKSILVGAQAYREQYGLDSIFLLPANLYGPRDNFDLETSHVIPGLIRKMLDNSERVTLWGDGSPTREFLYVDDCVEGLVLAAERYDGADAVNLGTGAEISIRELAELIAELTGFEGEIEWDSSMPNGQPRRSLDASRARELFGFEARTPLREGLERTIAWYREHAGAIAAALRRELGRRGAAAVARAAVGRRLRRDTRARARSVSPPRRSAALIVVQWLAVARAGADRQAQRLALLRRRRPALALHRRLSARPRTPTADVRGLRLVDPAAAGGRCRRTEPRFRAAGDRPLQHRRAAAGCAALRVRRSRRASQDALFGYWSQRLSGSRCPTSASSSSSRATTRSTRS